MGQATMELHFSKDPVGKTGITVWALKSILGSLPEGTELVSIQTRDGRLCTTHRFVFENKFFKDGADVDTTFRRFCRVENDVIEEVDVFCGINFDKLMK